MDGNNTGTFGKKISNLFKKSSDHFIIRNFSNALKVMLSERSVRFWFLLLLGIILLGLLGPYIAPYEYNDRQYTEAGDINHGAEPSLEHPLGTTDTGYDVMSRVLYGARPTLITGALGGGMIISIGLFVGVTAGYVGGRTENLLMRFTDMAYGVPLLPTALVIVGLLGMGFIQSVVVIGLILWRGSARVLRSQVLQIKERPFVTAARATGASTPRIIFKHILPNIGTMAVLFLALGVGYSILIQAGLAYLGVSDPTLPSWGMEIRNAQQAGMVANALWWSLPPGILISITVMATFMFGRGYESVAGQGDDEAFVEGA